MEMSSLKISDYIKNYCAHDLGNCKYFEFVYEILHAEGDGFFTRAQKFICAAVRLVCFTRILHVMGLERFLFNLCLLGARYLFSLFCFNFSCTRLGHLLVYPTATLVLFSLGTGLLDRDFLY